MIVCEFREACRRLARRPGNTVLPVAVLGVVLGVLLFPFSRVDALTGNRVVTGMEAVA